MRRIELHVSAARDVVGQVPPLLLNGADPRGWFRNSSNDQIDIDLRWRDPWADESVAITGGNLHAALRDLIPADKAPDRPVRKIALLFAHSWRLPRDVDGTIYGIMFDFEGFDDALGRFVHCGVPREGCAVFINPFLRPNLAPAERDRRIVFTVLHELGHVFNLLHDSSNSSIMTGSDTVWHPQKFLRDDCDRLSRAGAGEYPWYWNHLPGGQNYNEFLPLRGTLARTSSRRSPPMALGLTPGKGSYLLGELVVVELVLTARRGAARVPQALDPTCSNCRLWITRPNGERVRHRDPAHVCGREANTTIIRRGRPLRHNPRITFGARGLNFPLPGRYQLEADYVVSASPLRVVQSRVSTIEIRLPHGKIEQKICATLCDPYVGMFVAHRSGALPADKRDRLRELLRDAPRHPALQSVWYAFAVEHTRAGRLKQAEKDAAHANPADPTLKSGLRKLRAFLRKQLA